MTYVLRPVVDADLPRIADIVNAGRTEPITAEELLRQSRAMPPSEPLRQVAACNPDGEIIGWGWGRGGTGRKPGHIMVWVCVDSRYRGRGAARSLFLALQDWAADQGATVLDSIVKDQDMGSRAWAERQGFTYNHHLFQSKLDMGQWNPELFLPYVSRAEESGIRFTTLADEITSEETFQRYYNFRFGLGRDIPDVAGRALPTYERWREGLKENPAWDPHSVILAADGERWVAVSHLTRQPDGGHYNAFTGVDRTYRGRGLATAIKVVILERARQQGASLVTTSNHSVNAAMIAVNSKLGYVPYDGSYTLQKPLLTSGSS